MGLIPRRKAKRPPHRYGAHQIAVPVSTQSVTELSASIDTWQQRVLGYAEIIPEVMTGYLFVHNTMDMVVYELQRFDRMTGQWVADESPEISGIERRLNMGFKSGRAAALTHLVEEAYVIVERDLDNSLEFETLAPTEVRKKSDTVEIRVLGANDRVEWVPLEAHQTIIRIFTPDPSDRDRASGPHKPLLGLMETMALELSRDQADAISVLAGNGILAIPTEVLPDDVTTLDASTTPGSRAGFEEAFEESMTLTIADRRRGDAVVPITLYGPAEYLKDIRHILPSRAEGATESGARMQMYIERYARSVDLPSQVILGIGDVNHWGDWKVDENTWAYHLEPRGQRIADALYDGFISGILTKLGRDASQYRLVPNATGAIAKSDMSASATAAYRVGAITVEAYIEAIGFDANDIKPDADELLLAQIAPGDAPAAETTPAMIGAPQRTAAASKNPVIIMRQASKIANTHQQRLENLFRRYIAKVAEDAARDGRKAKKTDQTDLQAEGFAAGAVTAADAVPFLGYQPGVYFAKYAEEFEAATNDELFAYLRRIATLTGQDYKTLRSVWANEFVQRAQIVTAQAEILSRTVGQRSFDSAKPMRISDNVIRTMSSTANGGTNAGNGAAGNTNHPTHAGQDNVMKDALTDSVGSYATLYTWAVGDPQRPFEPHQNLDGLQWTSWQEYDTLAVDDADSWLPGSVYFPGDHDGCQCSYDIQFVPQSEVPA